MLPPLSQREGEHGTVLDMLRHPRLLFEKKLCAADSLVSATLNKEG